MPNIAFGHRSVTHMDGLAGDSWWPYECGHCGYKTTGAILCRVNAGYGRTVMWLQCSNCKEPAVIDSEGRVHPGVAFGPRIEGLPSDTESAYEEARRCMAASAFVAAETLCRKILMHVAVEKGAEEGKSFAAYIDHLVAEGYVTPPMKDWVKLIKDHGNLANHRLEPSDEMRAKATVSFTAQLLRMIYEMGHIAKSFVPQPTVAQG